MTQLTLELHQQPRHTQRGAIYEWLTLQGEHGATDEEIQNALRLPGDTERPRRQELQKLGMVVDSERKRMTKHMRPATVWVAT